MTHRTGPAVRIRGLTVRYGDVCALEGLDLDLPRGAVALLGPNGAGKSSTLKSIFGFVRPTAGSIEIYGREVCGDRRKLRRRMGYMPERDAFLAGLSGFRAVALAGELSGLPRDEAYTRAHEMLHYAGIGESRYRPVDTYSAGMRQRVKLAQALVHDPPLLFLDEPTNGLDPPGRAEMLDLIRDLTEQQGKDVILSTHILPDAERTVDWIAIMNAGRLVTSGRRERLLPEGAASTFEVRVRGDATRVRAALASVCADADWRDGDDRELTGTLRLHPHAGTDAIFRAAADAGAHVVRLEPRHEKLEDVFFRSLEAKTP